MDNIIKEQIKFNINEIDKLLMEYDLIFKKVKMHVPDIFDMTILGSVLHSFYNGVEKIFEIIAKNVDNKVPIGNKSHQELLRQMLISTDKRGPIIDECIYINLREYATFRHFYRHAYSFQMNWEKMRGLVENIHLIWKDLKQSLEKICK